MSDTSSSTLEIYSWWQTEPEQTALGAVLQDFARKDPGIVVVDRAAKNALTAQKELQSRIRQNDPPDTFQVNGGADLRQYVGDGSSSLIEPLDDLAAAWEARIPPSVLDAVTFDHHVYAVPVDIARVNALFYNAAKLDKYLLKPPTTMAEFVQVAQKLKDNGEMPVAIGDAVPWTLELIFKGCLINADGSAQYYRDFVGGLNPYFTGAMPVMMDSKFGDALNCLSTILTYANTSAMRSLTWDEAVDAVIGGKAVMTIMGDWAHGEFLKGGTPYGEVPAPGSSSAFIFTTDTFVLPTGARNRAGARALLAEWGSKEGQAAFYPAKGSLPSRTDVDPGKFDDILRQTLTDFNGSPAQVPDWALAVTPEFSNAFDLALDHFADDGNAENVMLTAWNYYDVIAQVH